MGIWFPDVPRWIWALAALASMGTISLIAVRAFGEVRVRSLLIRSSWRWWWSYQPIAFGFGNDGIATGISTSGPGGFMPNGIQGV